MAISSATKCGVAVELCRSHYLTRAAEQHKKRKWVFTRSCIVSTADLTCRQKCTTDKRSQRRAKIWCGSQQQVAPCAAAPPKVVCSLRVFFFIRVCSRCAFFLFLSRPFAVERFLSMNTGRLCLACPQWCNTCHHFVIAFIYLLRTVLPSACALCHSFSKLLSALAVVFVCSGKATIFSPLFYIYTFAFIFACFCFYLPSNKVSLDTV